MSASLHNEAVPTPASSPEGHPPATETPGGLLPSTLRQLAADENTEPLAWALAYTALGFLLIPLPYREKAPSLKAWQELRLGPDDLKAHFARKRTNVGLLLGASGIADVDLDAVEARALAPHFLPPTLTFGRPSAPRSHWLYRVDERQETRQYQVGRESIIELRDTSKKGTPHQTVLPPSVHPSGEAYRFDDLREFDVIDAPDLRVRCACLAAAAVIMRLWPRIAGVRHDAALALAGTLLDAGLDADVAETFVRAVCAVAGDEEPEDRARAVPSTVEARSAGKQTTGAPRLRQLLASTEVERKQLDTALGWLSTDPADGVADDEDDADDKESRPRETAASALVRIMEESGAELWHNTDEEAYVTFEVNGHRETHRLRFKNAKRWLARRYYGERGRAPGAQALDDALGILEGRALFDGQTYRTAVRVAEVEVEGAPMLYLDLGLASWSVVELRAGHWAVIPSEACPVRFERRQGLSPLPVPEKGGDPRRLAGFINLDPDTPDFHLVLAWLVQALRGKGPYPILSIGGEQGSGKSTAARMIRSIVDPNQAALRALPRTEQEAFISAQTAHVLAYDNVSGIPHWFSDVMCRISTGGGFSVRALYTADEEQLFEACRPQLVNGITDIITRPDLAERALAVSLRRIGDGERRTERELYEALDAALPSILGGLLDAAAAGLARLPSVKLDRLPRMADFAVWATATEEAFGYPSGAFLDAYDAGRLTLIESTLDDDPVADAVRVLLDEPGSSFSGTATELDDALKLAAGYGEGGRPAPRSWPKTPSDVSKRIQRAATALREVGIAVEREREPGGARRRILVLEKVAAKARPARPGEGEILPEHSVEGDSGGDGLSGSSASRPVPARPGSPVPVPSQPVPARPGQIADSEMDWPVRDARDARDGDLPLPSSSGNAPF